MHRRVAGLRSCRRSRLDWGFYSVGFRLLSAASAVPSPSNNGQLKERPYTRKKGQSLEKKRRPEDDRGIFVDDLSATLDAHRARNRASVIRKIEAPLSQFISRPLLENTRVGEGVVERSRTTADGNDVEDGSRAPNTLRLDRTKHSTATDEDRKTTTDRMEEGVPTKASQRSESESIQRWPADSLQALKGVTKRGRRGYISSSDVLEYTGERKHPKIPWNIPPTRPVVLQRPWLLYMEDSGRTYVDRFVFRLHGTRSG